MDMSGQAAAAVSGFSVATIWTVFILGLTGGFGHCLMMCGPFVAAASLGEGLGTTSARSARGFQIGYHAGRLTTYSLIGLVLGALGGAGALAQLSGPFSPTAITRYLKLGAGALTITLGVWLLVRWIAGRSASIPEPGGWIASSRAFTHAAASIARRGGRWSFPLGMLMGLLPCGPLLPVEIAALASGTPLAGALIMFAFGMGTVPALAGFGLLTGLAGTKARGWFAPATAILVLALGIAVVAQGLAVVGV